MPQIHRLILFKFLICESVAVFDFHTMRVAAIDLGTNTFHLLIAEKKSGGRAEFIFRKTCVVKLGREGFNDGLISAKAFQRGIAAMKLFSDALKIFKPQKAIARATSAIRNCRNGNDFISKSEKLIRNKIEIISGEREAELIYHGVKNSFPLDSQPVLIMDIGGGSIEFIIANQSKIFWKKSIEAGAARLAEKFSLFNPAGKSEILRMNDYLRKVFTPVLASVRKYNPKILVGSSGSFDTFALMTGNKNHYRKTSSEIPFKEFVALHGRLIKSTKAERLKMKGLHRMRVDMIVPASICFNFILKETGIRKTFRSAYALKEGVIFSEIS